MNVTFDPAKDAANKAKHGVSLADAEAFEWGSAEVWPDTRRNYGEARMVALGYIGLTRQSAATGVVPLATAQFFNEFSLGVLGGAPAQGDREFS